MLGRQLNQATKDGIVDDVFNGDLLVVEAAAKWEADTKAIYNWLLWDYFPHKRLNNEF